MPEQILWQRESDPFAPIVPNETRYDLFASIVANPTTYVVMVTDYAADGRKWLEDLTHQSYIRARVSRLLGVRIEDHVDFTKSYDIRPLGRAIMDASRKAGVDEFHMFPIRHLKIVDVRQPPDDMLTWQRDTITEIAISWRAYNGNTPIPLIVVESFLECGNLPRRRVFIDASDQTAVADAAREWMDQLANEYTARRSQPA